MSDDTTNQLPDAATFEARMMARFDAMESLARETLARVEALEAKSYDTKPIWERALAEIVEVKQRIVGVERTLRDIDRRLTRVEANTLTTKADVQELDDRVDALERKAS